MSALCACGQPLHYSDPDVQAKVQELIDAYGEHIDVTTEEGTWRVQRHYIALHGIRAVELPELGLFEKVA